MSKRNKVIYSNIQPNHKEAEIWVTPTNGDGSKKIKYWNDRTARWQTSPSLLCIGVYLELLTDTSSLGFIAVNYVNGKITASGYDNPHEIDNSTEVPTIHINTKIVRVDGWFVTTSREAEFYAKEGDYDFDEECPYIDWKLYDRIDNPNHINLSNYFYDPVVGISTHTCGNLSTGTPPFDVPLRIVERRWDKYGNKTEIPLFEIHATGVSE